LQRRQHLTVTKVDPQRIEVEPKLDEGPLGAVRAGAGGIKGAPARKPVLARFGHIVLEGAFTGFVGNDACRSGRGLDPVMLAETAFA
jgi:hypothetical protein